MRCFISTKIIIFITRTLGISFIFNPAYFSFFSCENNKEFFYERKEKEWKKIDISKIFGFYKQALLLSERVCLLAKIDDNIYQSVKLDYY